MGGLIFMTLCWAGWMVYEGHWIAALVFLAWSIYTASGIMYRARTAPHTLY